MSALRQVGRFAPAAAGNVARSIAVELAAVAVAAIAICGVFGVFGAANAQERGAAPSASRPATPAANAAPSAERGKKLYHDHGCYGCHGFNGETGARDLVGTQSPFVTNEDAFILFLRLRADQAPLLPATRMPNYPVEALSDAAARDIFAFMRTFKLDAPAVADEPTLKAIVESVERAPAR